MEVVPGNLYDHPSYYDLVFGSDWKAEFDFLRGCFERHASGRVQRLFEPACGTGRLLYRFAQAGFDIAGLDLNPRAVAFCNDRLRRHNLPATAFVADMTDFQLPRKADAAFNTINSFRHLPTEAAARRHLRCVAANLRRGGLYVLGLHLTPTEGPAIEREAWSAGRGNLRVNTSLETVRRDLRRRMEYCAMTFDVYTPTRSFQLTETLAFRIYTARHMQRLLATVPRLTVGAK